MANGAPSRRRRGLVAGGGALLLLGLLATAPAHADTTPVTWDGGLDVSTRLTSDPVNWAGDVGPSVTGDDSLVFPALRNHSEVLYDSTNAGGQAAFEAWTFADDGYLVEPTDLAFVAPRLYGDGDVLAGGEERLILAEAAGTVQLDLPIELDPQEGFGHVTAADPATVISCVPVNPLEAFYRCYDLLSGSFAFDGPGTHVLYGPLHATDDGSSVHVREGRTIMAGEPFNAFTTYVEDGGTLQLGDPATVDDDFGVVTGLLMVGGGGRIEGNGNQAECECFGVLIVGLDDEIEGVATPPGPGTLSPGFAGALPEDRIGVWSAREVQLGPDATYEVDWQQDGDTAECDRLDTNLLSLGDGSDDRPVLDVRLPEADLPAGTTCTIVDLFAGDEDPSCAEGTFEAPDGTDLDQLEGAGLLTIPNDAARNGVEVLLVDHCATDGSVTLTVLPTVRWTADDGAEATLDGVGLGYSVSDTVQELGEDTPEDGDLVFELTLNGGAAVPGDDYTPASGELVVGAQHLANGFQQAVLDDDLEEDAEDIDGTWAIEYPDTWDAPDYHELDPPQVTGVIVDDDEPVASVADVSVPEDVGEAVVTISLSQPSVLERTFEVETSDGTATAGSDYEAVVTTVTIPEGDPSATVEVPITDDAAVEGAETFSLRIVETTGEVEAQAAGTVSPAAVGDGDAVVTIEDDDVPATTTTTSTTTAPTTSTTAAVAAAVASPLPRTGSAPGPLLATGLGLVSAGALLAARARRLR